MKKLLKRFFTGVNNNLSNNPSNRYVQILQAMEYRRIHEEVGARTPGNIALQGFKVYSQHDEDGIIEAIFKLIAGNRAFIEIGIQDGTECNSLNLLLNGWKGVWIEGDGHYVEKISKALGGNEFDNNFKVVNSFVTIDNIVAICEASRKFLNVPEIDFFSLDIDGNDLHIIRTLLQNGFAPKVFCVEYNGKFPPPMELTVRYDANHVWDRTDYQGASLQSFVTLFESHGYVLITCNLVGVNAFFVKNEFAKQFKVFPANELFQPCRYYLSPMMNGHKPSLRFLANLLNDPSRRSEV